MGSLIIRLVKDQVHFCIKWLEFCLRFKKKITWCFKEESKRWFNVCKYNVVKKEKRATARRDAWRQTRQSTKFHLSLSSEVWKDQFAPLSARNPFTYEYNHYVHVFIPGHFHKYRFIFLLYQCWKISSDEHSRSCHIQLNLSAYVFVYLLTCLLYFLLLLVFLLGCLFVCLFSFYLLFCSSAIYCLDKTLL